MGEGRTLTVNRRRHEVRAEDDTPLLYVLRNHLNLKGTRFGCGVVLCGAWPRQEPRAKNSWRSPTRECAGKNRSQ